MDIWAYSTTGNAIDTCSLIQTSPSKYKTTADLYDFGTGANIAHCCGSAFLQECVAVEETSTDAYERVNNKGVVLFITDQPIHLQSCEEYTVSSIKTKDGWLNFKLRQVA